MTEVNHIVQKPGFWNNSIKWLSRASWIMIFFAMLLFHSGRPQVTNAIERQSFEKFRDSWDPQLATYFLSLMIIIINTSVMG